MYQITSLSKFDQSITVPERERMLGQLEEFNVEKNISGCGIVYDTNFLQIVEGAKKILQEYLDKITELGLFSDERIIWEGKANRPSFASWHTIYRDKRETGSNYTEFLKNMRIISSLMESSTACVDLFWSKVRSIFAVQNLELLGK